MSQVSVLLAVRVPMLAKNRDLTLDPAAYFSGVHRPLPSENSR